MYSRVAFTTGLMVSELPYLLLAALPTIVVAIGCYWSVGFPSEANQTGAVIFICIMYDLVYTGIRQLITAYAPVAMFAALVVVPLSAPGLILWCFGAE